MRHIVGLRDYRGSCSICGHENHIPLLAGNVISVDDNKTEIIISSVSTHHCSNCLHTFDIFRVQLAMDVTKEFNNVLSKKEIES